MQPTRGNNSTGFKQPATSTHLPARMFTSLSRSGRRRACLSAPRTATSALLSHWACRGHLSLPPPTHLSLLLLPLLPPPSPPPLLPPIPPPTPPLLLHRAEGGRARRRHPAPATSLARPETPRIVNDRLAALEIVAAVGYSPSRGSMVCVGGARTKLTMCTYVLEAAMAPHAAVNYHAAARLDCR